jgi:hypothetical protein
LTLAGRLRTMAAELRTQATEEDDHERVSVRWAEQERGSKGKLRRN